MATNGVSNLRNKVPFNFLEHITAGFSEERKLGTGALGTVYKGLLEDGTVIAVKRHVADAPGTHNQTAYCKKVMSLMRHTHENLAKLLSFCLEENNRDYTRRVAEERIESLLCYEYFSRGSLHKSLFEEPASNLDWNTRFKIIKGISEGLHFLHTVHEPDQGRILHLDLKPKNIMLDDNMVPKITDFAYSRLYGKDTTRRSTVSSVGSVGYRAPEYVAGGHISRRTDIYSLGLIIMEIITKEQNSSCADEPSAREFIEEVKRRWNSDGFIINEYRSLDKPARRQVKACIEIGIKCVDLTEKERPTTKYILEKLRQHS